jgi:hypothetical protein
MTEEESRFQVALIIDGYVAEVLSADDSTLNLFLNYDKVIDITEKIQSNELVDTETIGAFYYEPTNTFRVAKPFLSWTWDNSISGWVAPTPMPNDEKDYVWLEEGQIWAEVGTESLNLPL